MRASLRTKSWCILLGGLFGIALALTAASGLVLNFPRPQRQALVFLAMALMIYTLQHGVRPLVTGRELRWRNVSLEVRWRYVTAIFFFGMLSILLGWALDSHDLAIGGGCLVVWTMIEAVLLRWQAGGRRGG